MKLITSALLALILLFAPRAFAADADSNGQVGGRYKVLQKTNINEFIDDLKLERIDKTNAPKGINYRISVSVAKGAFSVGDIFVQQAPLIDGDLYMVVQKTINPGAARGDLKLSRIVAWYKGKPAIKGLSYIVSVTVSAEEYKKHEIRDLVRRGSGSVQGLNEYEEAQLKQPSGDDKLGRGQLIIKSVPQFETDENYLSTIRHLTVPPDKQTDPAFVTGTDVAAIKKLETENLRRQIFEAMNNNPMKSSIFSTRKAAEENFAIRLEMIAFMRKIQNHDYKRQPEVRFDYYDSNHPPLADNPNWAMHDEDHGAAGTYFGTRTDVKISPYSAITGLAKSHFCGECLGAIQITILQSVAQVIGKERFDAMHPEGLQYIAVPGTNDKFSIYKNINTFGQNDGITFDAMIPGDWAYMQNKADFRDWSPGGYWVGENSIYMGKYTANAVGTPTYSSTAAPRFSGMGLYDLSEKEMKDDMVKKYNELTNPNSPPSTRADDWKNAGRPWKAAVAADTHWTLLARPHAEP